METLHEDKLVLVVPPGHPLTALESVKLSHVGKYGLLLPKQGRRRESLDYLFAQNKVALKIAMELDSSELLKRLILAGIGIGFLPRINVLEELKQGLVETVEIEGLNLPRNLALISRRDTVLSRAGDAFFTFATGSVRGLAHEDAVDSSLELPD